MNSIHVATTRWTRNKGKTGRENVQPKLTASNVFTRFSAPKRITETTKKMI